MSDPYRNPADEKPYNRGKYDAPTPARGVAPVPQPLPDGQTVRQPGYPTYDELAAKQARHAARPANPQITWRWALTMIVVGTIIMVLVIAFGPATGGRY